MAFQKYFAFIRFILVATTAYNDDSETATAHNNSKACKLD